MGDRREKGGLISKLPRRKDEERERRKEEGVRMFMKRVSSRSTHVRLGAPDY